MKESDKRLSRVLWSSRRLRGIVSRTQSWFLRSRSGEPTWDWDGERETHWSQLKQRDSDEGVNCLPEPLQLSWMENPNKLLLNTYTPGTMNQSWTMMVFALSMTPVIISFELWWTELYTGKEKPVGYLNKGLSMKVDYKNKWEFSMWDLWVSVIKISNVNQKISFTHIGRYHYIDTIVELQHTVEDPRCL